MKKLLIILIAVVIIVPFGIFVLLDKNGGSTEEDKELAKIAESTEEYTEKAVEISSDMNEIYDSIVQLDSVNYEDNEAYEEATQSVVKAYEKEEVELNKKIEAIEKEYEEKLEGIKQAIDLVSVKEADMAEESEDGQGISEERLALEVEIMKLEALLSDLKMEKDVLDETIKTIKQ